MVTPAFSAAVIEYTPAKGSGRHFFVGVVYNGATRIWESKIAHEARVDAVRDAQDVADVFLGKYGVTSINGDQGAQLRL